MTPWTVAHQAPLSRGFSRQECWSGLPCPTPGGLPDPRIEPMAPLSPALPGRFFTTSATWNYLAGDKDPCQIDGETMERVTDFIFLGSKITADGDCSHEIKRCLLLGRKAITNLEGILKSRNIILLTKVCLVKAMVFPVVMYGCERWTIKKAECRRIDAFELWCWEDSWDSLGQQGDQTSSS